jgi:hypothetical protein
MMTSWKQMERDVGKLIGGKRYPANQGGRVDVESDTHVVQCKERKSLSLEQLTQLVEEIEAIGAKKGKQGLVAVKVRRGRGKKSPILIVQSAEQWSVTNPVGQTQSLQFSDGAIPANFVYFMGEREGWDR